MTEYFAGIIALFILRSTNHYRIETKKKHGFLKHKYKNHVTYDYVNDGSYNKCSHTALWNRSIPENIFI